MKKKEFQQAEISFRLTEKELREKDQEIQEQLIQFAAYLDTNTKVIKKCEDNIEQLKVDNVKKDEETLRKTRLQKILKNKAESIRKQKEAVQKYHNFLEDVRNENSDEFAEVSNIIERYGTLKDSQRTLREREAALDAQILNKQKDIN
jgi:predicted esterase YcpF (UPF0227 family)